MFVTRSTQRHIRSAARRGAMSTLWMMMLGSIGVVAALVAMLVWGRPSHDVDAERIEVYCAAGMRVPMEEIARQYEEETGVKVDLQLGGSGSLLNQLEVNKFSEADLYLAADDHYTDLAREKGLAAEVLPVAHQRPVIAVKKDSTKNIESIKDLLRDDVSVVLADPDQAAVGWTVREQLAKISVGETNRWEQLEKNIIAHGVFKPTVNEAANDVKIGAVDAAIVWDSTVAMPKYRDVLKAIPVSELEGDPKLVSIAVLNSSRHPTAALKFARYVAGRNKGLPVFEEYGTRPVEGDVWADDLEITFFCGAVNRRAVESLVDDFQRREGVVVNTIYNGCGFLTEDMKIIKRNNESTQLFPDVYMACDLYYLENVRQWFQESANVSDVEIVIAVPKGSDKVQALADLVKPGIRVSVGEPDACTIGALTRRLLTREGLYEKLKEKQMRDGEIVVEKNSSAALVPDVVLGHVDATVAYISDVLANKEHLDMVRIKSPLNLAIQPLSIARSSEHKHIVRRLVAKIAASPEAFETAGFHFRLTKPAADKPKG